MVHNEAERTVLQLPVAVVGRGDIGRLLREVEDLQEFLSQAAIREPGKGIALPRTSRLLDETAQANKLNLLISKDVDTLKQFLSGVKVHAPVLHISFSVDPSPAFVSKLLSWLRQEISPIVLVQVGLQPTIAAGCILRTPNRQYDFSLRKHFTSKRDVLTKLLQEAIST